MKIVHRPPGGKSTQGFSLIEVLVAVLILAIGLLGVAGVQVVSMQNTSNANLRTQATVYAQDMAEQIRAHGGSLPSNGDIDAWEDRLVDALGPDAEANITSSGNVFQIQLEWIERDSAAEDEGGEESPGAGRSRQSFTYRIEV
ncbi:type IV pilus modification protein PilV [Marinobacter sp.]|uniref:type IV pilus modification protein PilV n=1 Tax=Marinobacter sp. TaxID=50741 RepID=UPI0035673ABC